MPEAPNVWPGLCTVDGGPTPSLQLRRAVQPTSSLNELELWMASRRVVAETCDAGPDTNTHSDEPAHDGHTVTPTSDVEVHVGRESVHSHENASDAALAKAEEVTEEIKRLKARAAGCRARAALDAVAVAEARTRTGSTVGPDLGTSSDTASALVKSVAALRARLANATTLNSERTELARQKAEQYRLRLQEVGREHDRARDQMLLLRERWLQGFDSVEDSVALGEISSRMRGQQLLLNEYRDVLDVGRAERRALVARLEAREKELSLSLEAADIDQRERGAKLAAIRQATEAVAADQRKHMHDLDVARRQAAAVETELHDVNERAKSAKLSLVLLRKRHATAMATLDAARVAMQKKTGDLAAEQERLRVLESDVEHTNELALAAVRECEALGLDPDVVLALALKYERESPSRQFDIDDEDSTPRTRRSVGGVASPAPLSNTCADIETAEITVAVRAASIAELQEALHRAQAEVDDCETEMSLLDFEAESAPSQLAAVLEHIGFPVPADAVDSGVTAVFDSLEQGILSREADLKRAVSDLQSNTELHRRAHDSYQRTLRAQEDAIARAKDFLHRTIIGVQNGQCDPDCDTDDEDESLAPPDVTKLRLTATRLVLDLASARRQLAEEKVKVKAAVMRQWESTHDVGQCPGCTRPFSLFLWRRHCRVCGGVYCGSCTERRLRTTVHPQPVRCCEACYEHTLRAQRLRQLERRESVLTTQIEGSESAPATLSSKVKRPRVCYSASCRAGDGGAHACYSPHCQYDAETVSPVVARRQAFLRLSVALKERHEGGPVVVSAEDMWELAQLHRVSTEAWVPFILYVLTHGEPEFRLKFDESVMRVAEQIASCQTESELLQLGAKIKDAVAKGMPERGRIYLRFAFRERLGLLRMTASPPPLDVEVTPVMCGDEDETSNPGDTGNTSMCNYYEGDSLCERNNTMHRVECLVWEGNDTDDDAADNDDVSSPDSEFGPAVTPSMLCASGLPLSPPSLSVSMPPTHSLNIALASYSVEV